MTCTVDILRSSVPTFAALPEQQIQWLIDHSECRTLAPGETLFARGEPAVYMHIVYSGRLRITLEQGGQPLDMGTLEPGFLTGLLPYSRLQQAAGSATALTTADIISLHRDHFPDMIRSCHELTEALVHQMTTRVRDFTAMQQQHDKLAALGKLSAGLAHELNNPAAAIVRSSTELKKHLGAVPDRFKRVISIRMTAEQVDAVNTILFTRLAAGPVHYRSMMDRTEREDDLVLRLEHFAVADPYGIASTLADYGFTTDDLDRVEALVSAHDRAAVVEWIDNVITTERLVSEIQEASRRISDLVGAVKSYTHMDRSTDREAVDVRDSIHTTLKIMQHKLKHSITVATSFPDRLPALQGFPGELAQVWTNIIDNAADAMETTGGRLDIIADSTDGVLTVRFIDSGPGIPPDVQARMFDPFFTTKEVGRGTGLGLDVVRRILAHHRGTIRVSSEPGRTEVCVSLPLS